MKNIGGSRSPRGLRVACARDSRHLALVVSSARQPWSAPCRDHPPEDRRPHAEGRAGKVAPWTPARRRSSRLWWPSTSGRPSRRSSTWRRSGGERLSATIRSRWWPRTRRVPGPAHTSAAAFRRTRDIAFSLTTWPSWILARQRQKVSTFFNQVTGDGGDARAHSGLLSDLTSYAAWSSARANDSSAIRSVSWWARARHVLLVVVLADGQWRSARSSSRRRTDELLPRGASCRGRPGQGADRGGGSRQRAARLRSVVASAAGTRTLAAA